MEQIKPVIVAAIIIVNLALISYTIFVIFAHKKKNAHNKVVFFITAGVICDITATICMIIGSENSPFSLHGIMGYTALLAMFIDAVSIWKHRIKFDSQTSFPKWLNIYSKISYSWWIIAYITGSIIVSKG
jgi:EamA domain-containing membrane protein RarD